MAACACEVKRILEMHSQRAIRVHIPPMRCRFTNITMTCAQFSVWLTSGLKRSPTSVSSKARTASLVSNISSIEARRERPCPSECPAGVAIAYLFFLSFFSQPAHLMLILRDAYVSVLFYDMSSVRWSRR